MEKTNLFKNLGATTAMSSHHSAVIHGHIHHQYPSTSLVKNRSLGNTTRTQKTLKQEQTKQGVEAGINQNSFSKPWVATMDRKFRAIT